MPTLTEAIASFAHKLTFNSLPTGVVIEAKYRVLDFLGNTLAARNEPSSHIVLDWVLGQNSNPDSSIIAHGSKVASHYAALVNGVMGHSLELDDSLPAVVHPGVVVLPPSLALAEREKVDGRTLITAVVLGYEVACRIGSAATPIGVLQDKGFHPTGVNGVFGATISASKILGLSEEQIATAMGIAGSLSSGLLECTRDGTWTKRLHPGWAAHNGILAAELAAKGYTAPHLILEGRLGYLHAFVGESSTPLAIVERLGESFQIAKPGYKPYACCKACHAPINAVLKMLEGRRINPKQIENVEVRMQRVPYLLTAEPRERKYYPETTVDAQFSVFFSIATTILRGKPPLWDAFSEANIRDAETLALAKRVTAMVDPELEKLYAGSIAKGIQDAIVTITMDDGRVLKERNSQDFDHPPLGSIEDKFRICAASVLEEDQLDDVLEKIKNLERLDNIIQLMAALRRSSSA